MPLMGPHLALHLGEAKGATMDSLNSLEKLIETEKKAIIILEEAEQRAAQIRLEAQKKAADLEQEKILETRTCLESESARIRKALEEEIKLELDSYKHQLHQINRDKNKIFKLVWDIVRQDN